MADSLLSMLKPGQQGKVLKVNARGETGKRMMEMGLMPGILIEMKRIAPLGDPVDVKIRGYHLSLRKEEAQNVLVETL